MIETGLVVVARGRSAALRPVPQPGDVPDHRFPRPGDRVRRPGDERGCAGEVPQLAGDAALFRSGRTLYNGKDAQTAARAGKPVIVVEGYLDVIAAVTAGFEGTVAPLGTALTEEHLQLLWRMNEAPILCFDGDEAGLRAAERAAELVLPLLKPGQTVKIATLPEGLDPDDLIKQAGRDAFADVLDRARALSDMIWGDGDARRRARDAGGAGGARGAAAGAGRSRSPICRCAGTTCRRSTRSSRRSSRRSARTATSRAAATATIGTATTAAVGSGAGRADRARGSSSPTRCAIRGC